MSDLSECAVRNGVGFFEDGVVQRYGALERLQSGVNETCVAEVEEAARARGISCRRVAGTSAKGEVRWVEIV